MLWLKIVYFGIMALALLASLRGYNRKGYVLFIPYLAVSLAWELLRHAYPDSSHIFRYFIAIEYTFLSLIIASFIQSRTKRLVIISSLFILVPILIFIESAVLDKSTSYKYLDLLIAAPFICAWTILYLFETVKQEEEFEVTKNPMFWISLGNLLFFSGSFFSYGFGSYLAFRKSDTAESVFWIARILNIVLYVLYFIGFLCLKKKK